MNIIKEVYQWNLISHTLIHWLALSRYTVKNTVQWYLNQFSTDIKIVLFFNFYNRIQLVYLKKIIILLYNFDIVFLWVLVIKRIKSPGCLKQVSLCNRLIFHNVSKVSFDSVVNSLGADSRANSVIISGHML